MHSMRMWPIAGVVCVSVCVCMVATDLGFDIAANTQYDPLGARAFQFGQKKSLDSIRFSLPNRFFRFDSAI